VLVTDNLQATYESCFVVTSSMRGLRRHDHALQGGLAPNPLG
jgi:hypothetical protein